MKSITGYRNKNKYKVDENGCWVWTGAGHTKGYGTVSIDGEIILAHRYFYEKHKGPIPPHHDVHHTCRNRLCVNPDHLEALTRRKHRKLSQFGSTDTCPL